MAVKLAQKQALDIRKFTTETFIRGLHVLDPDLEDSVESMIESMDLCDGQTEEWIWSVGRVEGAARYDAVVDSDVLPGDVYFSTDARFYQKPGWKCLWLR